MGNENPWEMLSKKMQEKIAKRGFGSPTSVQKEGIPQILSGSNVLLMAPTGCGKTETSLLPIFDKWLKGKQTKDGLGANSGDIDASNYKPISILYITPMKSLNRDLHKRILWWSKELDMDSSVRHGDTTQYERGMQRMCSPT